MLSVEVLGGDDAPHVARQIRVRALAVSVRVEVTSSPEPSSPVAFRVAAPSLQDDTTGTQWVDLVLTKANPLDAQVDRLWRDRLQPWAAHMAGQPVSNYPPVIQPHDPQWTWTAQRRIHHLRLTLTALDPAGEFRYDHIGSTSVPGLAAKAVIDLQTRVPQIPEPDGLEKALHRVGYLPARGSRPDSPGVSRDTPRGSEVVPDEVWAKRLFYCPDPVLPSIVHIRRTDSPFGRHTVWFRDWLRAHPHQRDRYQEFKTRLAEQHAHDNDYDDYTRAKTQFFDEVHRTFEQWANGESR